MANTTLFRPLREAHLGDERGLDPVMAAAGRRALIERRRRARQRLQQIADRAQGLVVEAGADLAGVHEPFCLVHAQVESAEGPARALGIGPAADDELLPQVALDLEPV